MLLQLLFSVVLCISLFYPFYRGLKQVCWWKSIQLGWGFLILACVLQQHLTPFLVKQFTADSAQQESPGSHSYLLLVIALGWFAPLIFHYLGACTANEIRRRKARKEREQVVGKDHS